MEAEEKKKEKGLSHHGGVGGVGGAEQLVLLSGSGSGWQTQDAR